MTADSLRTGLALLVMAVPPVTVALIAYRIGRDLLRRKNGSQKPNPAKPATH